MARAQVTRGYKSIGQPIEADYIWTKCLTALSSSPNTDLLCQPTRTELSLHIRVVKYINLWFGLAKNIFEKGQFNISY